MILSKKLYLKENILLKFLKVLIYIFQRTILKKKNKETQESLLPRNIMMLPRLIKTKGQSLCTACQDCVEACPTNAIEVQGRENKDEMKEFYLDFSKCTSCGDCVMYCDEEALVMGEKTITIFSNREDMVLLSKNLLINK